MNTTRIIKRSFLKLIVMVTITIFMAFGTSSSAVFRFTPSISVSEVYTDNYNQREDDVEGEFSTEYLFGTEFESFFKRGLVSLSYDWSYIDYNEHDENDSWQHYLNLSGLINLTRHTDLTLTELFSRSNDISQRTGTWENHDTNAIMAALLHRFGRRNSVGLNFSYFFNKYDDPNVDDYESIYPSIFLDYWLNMDYGFRLSAFYEKTDFDLSGNEEETVSGDFRFIRQMADHLQIYVEYGQSWSEDDIEEHTIYDPLVGFAWTISETSSISIGTGVLVGRYENQEDSELFFVDLNVFKLFDFSQRGSFAISASSGHGEISEDAASLGFRIYYRAGLNYNYALTRQVNLDISTSYLRDKFTEELTDRLDNTFNLRAGVTWNPFNWMALSLSYSYNNFQTDADIRNDYVENRAIFTVTFTPFRPRQTQEEATLGQTRENIESRIFD